MTYAAAELRRFCRFVFERLGVNREDASVAADVLIRADLEGTDSHGISRLPIYAKRMKEGRIHANPAIAMKKTGESVLLVDGDNGLGPIVSVHACRQGMSIAKETGAAAVAVRGSNHFGAASYYCQMACDQGLAAMVFTNSPPGIPPWGGARAFFGTNPIAFGFPTGTEAPVMIDMSTSVVARGKIILAAKQGQPIPKGWAINARGEETEDPEEALAGAVLPVGGAKGCALSLAVEVLTGVLSGAAFGPHVQNLYSEGGGQANVGHFFLLLDVEKFMPLERFTHLMSVLLQEMKAVPRMPGVKEILFPGERRAKERAERVSKGIRLPPEVEKELAALGKELKVTFPKKLLLSRDQL